MIGKIPRLTCLACHAGGTGCGCHRNQSESLTSFLRATSIGWFFKQTKLKGGFKDFFSGASLTDPVAAGWRGGNRRGRDGRSSIPAGRARRRHRRARRARYAREPARKFFRSARVRGTGVRGNVSAPAARPRATATRCRPTDRSRDRGRRAGIFFRAFAVSDHHAAFEMIFHFGPQGNQRRGVFQFSGADAVLFLRGPGDCLLRVQVRIEHRREARMRGPLRDADLDRGVGHTAGGTGRFEVDCGKVLVLDDAGTRRHGCSQRAFFPAADQKKNPPPIDRRLQAMISCTTLPCTSVRRKSRPE